MSGGLRTEPETLSVYFNGVLAGFGAIPMAAVFGGMMLLPFTEIRLMVGGMLAFVVGYMLVMIGGSFDRRPLLVVEPDGVRLPCAGNIMLGYDEIDVWAEERSENRKRYWIFALQRRPRLHLDISWWTWLRFVRANRLVDGDLRLDARFIGVDPQELAAAIQARIDRATG